MVGTHPGWLKEGSKGAENAKKKSQKHIFKLTMDWGTGREANIHISPIFAVNAKKSGFGGIPTTSPLICVVSEHVGEGQDASGRFEAEQPKGGGHAKG